MRYRIEITVRREGETPLDQNKFAYKSEEFANDEELSDAVRNEVLQTLEEDRDYLDSVEGTE